MDPKDVKTAADARAIVEERGLSHVKVGVFDIDGVMRGKYMGRDKFFSALEKGFGFCDVVLGWDSNDQLYDNVQLHRLAHRLSGRAGARRCPTPAAPCRSKATCCCSSASSPARPRRSARAARCAACSTGPPRWASRSTRPPSSSSSCSTRRRTVVREKSYRDLTTMTPGFFGYSMLRASVHAEFYHELLTALRRHADADRGPAHRDRPRRAGGRDRVLTRRSRPPTAARCSRPSPRCSPSAAA